MTIHNEAKKNQIAKTVIVMGDPLRAKYIADKYLNNPKLVNQVRNMYAYTGTYKGKNITVMGHGMGIPSIGIYATELYKFYDVDNIIRIGTAGSLKKDIKITDLILANSAYSLSTFNQSVNGENAREYCASDSLMETIEHTAEKLNLKIYKGKIISTDTFEPYYDMNIFEHNYPKDNYLASEMETFALFFLAKYFNKKAAAILTIVDSEFDSRELTSEQRQKSLNDMILLALESVI